MNNSIINQLKGFLNTPPLWNNRGLFELEQFDLPEYSDYLDLDPIVAMPSLSTNFVLGKRIETFFELVIKQSGNYKIIARNLQIHKDKITIGEIDFFVHNLQQKKDLHIEVVYKFYVYDPSYQDELKRWIGPNRKDSLLQKIDKLKNNQLPLIFNPVATKVLNSFYLEPENLYQQVCFKANLFIPKNLEGKQFLYINNKCIAGYWIHFLEFSEKDYGQFAFFAPKKQDWPGEPQSQDEWVNYAEVKTQILELFDKGSSPLIWMKKTDKVYERFFVVWWQEKKDGDDAG